MNKKIDINETKPKPKTKPKAKPKPKHEFSQEAREGWKYYQDIRETNKILNKMNKKYSRPIMDRQLQLKQNLLNNPQFVEDFERILKAYEDDIDLAEKELKILEIFDFKSYI
jgi:hypothetical protein